MQGFPLVLSLPLPAVNCEHVGVQHDGQAAYSGVEARHLAPEAWQALEAALQPGLEGHPSGTWLDGERWMRAGWWPRLQSGVHTQPALWGHQVVPCYAALVPFMPMLARPLQTTAWAHPACAPCPPCRSCRWQPCGAAE